PFRPPYICQPGTCPAGYCVDGNCCPPSGNCSRSDIHQAYVLTDPAGQQTATFDLFWGGSLASLKYYGTETIWGNDPGGMVQPSWFTYPLGGGHPGYNPEQAGGNGAGNPGGDPFLGTPTFAVSCPDSNTLLVIGGSTDYFSAEGGFGCAPGTSCNNGY